MQSSNNFLLFSDYSQTSPRGLDNSQSKLQYVSPPPTPPKKQINKKKKNKRERENGRRKKCVITRNYISISKFFFKDYLLLLLQFVRPTRSSYIRIHRSDGTVVFSVDVAITAAVLYPVGSLGRTIEFTTSVAFTEKKTYYVTLDPGNFVFTSKPNITRENLHEY